MQRGRRTVKMSGHKGVIEAASRMEEATPVRLNIITIAVMLFGLIGMFSGCSVTSGGYTCTGDSSSAYTHCVVVRGKNTSHFIDVECLSNNVVGGKGWVDQVKNESGRTCETEISVHRPDGTVDRYTKSGYFSPVYDGYSAFGVSCPYYDEDNAETCARMCGTCSNNGWIPVKKR